MSQLFETIRIENDKAHNLVYHQQRMQASLKSLFQISYNQLIKNSDIKSLNLNLKNKFESQINSLQDLFSHLDLKEEKHKCRIVYSNKIESINFEIYKPRQLKKFKLIFDDKIEYSFKYTDRKNLDLLYSQKEEADDIIIVKNKKVTDTSIANLIFFDGNAWLTPKQPLLKGTKRALMLEEKQIAEIEISVDDLKYFKSFLPINSMIEVDLKKAIPISNIINL